MKVLVTGGAGYIGSHTVVRLLERGNEVVIVDDLSNSHQNVIERIERITNKAPSLIVQDIRDTSALLSLFEQHTPDAVIHFAGLKAVGESVNDPLRYYRVNIDSTLSLLEAMKASGVHKLVFSSSATVYGLAPSPYEEAATTGQGITSPYGQTKYMIEQILSDLTVSDSNWQIGALRYFNPVGAHPSGLIGEQPLGVPNNLMPYVTQVATGARAYLQVFGDDYDTSDGTGVRDYIHVCDLADGHLKMLDNLTSGFTPINLGSGRGTSVIELVHAFERVNGISIPYQVAPRREGDLPSFYANTNKAERVLDWHTKLNIEDMVRDSWNWQSNNPKGYE